MTEAQIKTRRATSVERRGWRNKHIKQLGELKSNTGITVRD